MLTRLTVDPRLVLFLFFDAFTVRHPTTVKWKENTWGCVLSDIPQMLLVSSGWLGGTAPCKRIGGVLWPCSVYFSVVFRLFLSHSHVVPEERQQWNHCVRPNLLLTDFEAFYYFIESRRTNPGTVVFWLFPPAINQQSNRPISLGTDTFPLVD